jgi:hypothetical protein
VGLKENQRINPMQSKLPRRDSSVGAGLAVSIIRLTHGVVCSFLTAPRSWSQSKLREGPVVATSDCYASMEVANCE